MSVLGINEITVIREIISKGSRKYFKGVSYMKQVVKIMRKTDVENQYARILQLELDYELASLFQAIEMRNELEMLKSKARLKEIQEELKAIRSYV